MSGKRSKPKGRVHLNIGDVKLTPDESAKLDIGEVQLTPNQDESTLARLSRAAGEAANYAGRPWARLLGDDDEDDR